MKKVLIRSDASLRIGAGHLMRSVALAQRLHENGVQVLFMTVPSVEELNRYLRSQSFTVRFMNMSQDQPGSETDLEAVLPEVRRGYDWVVLDGYSFGPEFQKALQAAGPLLLVIDDRKEFSASADIAVNVGADPRFALIRSELLKLPKKKPGDLKNILVTLGGSRQTDTLLKITGALKNVDGAELNIKVVGGFEHETMPDGQGRHKIKFCRAGIENYKLYAWADLALCAAGGTAWELAFFRVPSLVGALSDLQAAFGEKLGESGAFQYLGRYSEISEAEIAQAFKSLLTHKDRAALLRKKMGELVDGKGAERIVETMKTVEKEKIKVGGRKNG